MFVENKFNPNALVTWLITLGLIICPSSYKARPDNLIGLYLLTDFCEEIISPQWSNARPNFPPKKFVGGAKFGLLSRLPYYYSEANCLDSLSTVLMRSAWPLLLQLAVS